MSDAQSTPTAAAAPTPPLSPKERAGRTPLMNFTQKWAGQIGITFAFVLLWVIFFLLAPDTFGRDLIYKSFGQTIPYFGIIAMMLTMVIVSGDIDLSFPSVMALGMVGFVWTWDATGLVLLAAVAAIGVGALAGLFNGLVITIVGLPSLVVTIGTQLLFRGLTLVLVGGSSYALASTRGDTVRDAFVGKPFGLPMEFFWFLGITILAWILLNRHRLGGNTYFNGDNEQTARLMGIPIRRTRITLFVLTGMAAALAGMMMSMQVVNFYPNLGTGLLLPALAAVFVGGTSVFGGRGSVYGTFIGALMIGAIPAGIVASGLTDFWTQAIYGGIILIAISIHAVLQRRFQR
jgi:simple sugar transport system permease protein